MSITDPKQREAIRKALGEASGSLTRIEAERSLIKEIASKCKEDHAIEPKIFRKLLKAYHNQSFEQDVELMEEFQEVYESVLGSQNPTTP